MSQFFSWSITDFLLFIVQPLLYVAIVVYYCLEISKFLHQKRSERLKNLGQSINFFSPSSIIAISEVEAGFQGTWNELKKERPAFTAKLFFNKVAATSVEQTICEIEDFLRIAEKFSNQTALNSGPSHSFHFNEIKVYDSVNVFAKMELEDIAMRTKSVGRHLHADGKANSATNNRLVAV